MSDDVVWDKVVRWVGRISELPTIKDRPGQEVHYANYLLVNFILMDRYQPLNQDIRYREVGDDILVTPQSFYEWQFSVSARCSNDHLGRNILRRIKEASSLPETQEPLWPDLRINRTSAVRDLPVIRNERWERTSQMDLFVHGVVGEEFDSFSVEQFSFDFVRN